MSNHIELFIERVVGLMADRLDERSKASQAKRDAKRARLIAQGHEREPYLKGQWRRHPPKVADDRALVAARKKINSTPTPEEVAKGAQEERRRAAEYKYNVGKVERK
jgi:hypothetical protein